MRGSTLTLSYHYCSAEVQLYADLRHRVVSLRELFDLVEGPIEPSTPEHSVRQCCSGRLLRWTYLFMYCLQVRVFLMLAEPSWFPSTC